MNNTDFKVSISDFLTSNLALNGVYLMDHAYLFSQQLYQTLSDFDIRFYMYEILKVRDRFYVLPFMFYGYYYFQETFYEALSLFLI